MEDKFKYLRGFKLDNLENVQPTMLIGLRHAKLLSTSDVRKPKDDEDGPVLSQIELSWMVWSPTVTLDEVKSKPKSSNCHVAHVYVCRKEDDIEKVRKSGA